MSHRPANTSKPHSNSNPQPQESRHQSDITMKHGVYVTCDPVLRVYIENILAKERSGEVIEMRLSAATDEVVSDESLFLSGAAGLTAEKVNAGLVSVVNPWMDKNSFAQLDEESDDERVAKAFNAANNNDDDM